MAAAASIAEAELSSVRDCDQYLVHLCTVSMQEQLVLAAEDVHNQFGILLLRQGTPLGDHALHRLQGHRLNTPLDEAFTLRLTPDAHGLAQDVLALAEREPDLAAITRSVGLAERMENLCAAADLPRALLQKLAVMQRVLPRIYQRALFSTWMGTALATRRELPDNDVLLVMLAGLLHDIGLLHLAPELPERRGDISAEDWSAIRAHPRRSAQVLLESWPSAPARLARIVAEHHERHDGAGYPDGITGIEQDPLSGILGLADMLHALRFDTTPDRVASLADCLPFLRVNRRTWGIENYRPAARLLLAARDASPKEATLATPSPQGLIDANRSLGQIVALIPAARTLLSALGDNRTARSLLQVLEELESTACAAGLGADMLSASLHDNLREGRIDPGLGDVALTLRESLWLVRRADRQLRDLLQQRTGAEDAPQLKDLSLRLRSELTRAWRRFEHPR